MSPIQVKKTKTDPSDSAPKPQILPHHEEYLSARAVPLELALDKGVRSMTPSEIYDKLGLFSEPETDGLAFPYPGDETYVRVRCTDGKWITKKCAQVPVYVAYRPLPTPTTLYICEGPVKALAMTAAGYSALGLGGVSTTLERKAGFFHLNTSWPSVTGITVVIVFDAGRVNNPIVAHAEARLAKALEQAGAAEVLLVQLPFGPDGKDQGPDDFIAANGADAFAHLEETVVHANPVTRVERLKGEGLNEELKAKAMALLGDLPFLLAVNERGAACVAAVRDFFKASGLTKIFDDALKEAGQLLDDAHKQRAENEGEQERTEPTYSIADGGFVREDPGGEWSQRLTNFTARITADETLDEGDGTHERALHLRAQVGEDKEVGVTLTPEDFNDPTWPLRKIGSNAIMYACPSAHHHVRVAVQEHSHDVERKVLIGHTGFRREGDQWVYVHARGVVGGAALDVRLPEKLARYVLPERVDDLRAAFAAGLEFLDIADRTVTAPLFCAVWIAAIQSRFPLPCMIWLFGKRDSYKTTLAAILLCFFGDFDERHLTATWADTEAMLEKTAFLVKDAIAVFDDFAPARADDVDGLRRKANNVIRKIGNVTGRGRMRADMTEQRSFPPRALVVSTAEDTTGPQSIRTRMHHVRVTPEAVHLDRVTEMQKVGRHLLSQLMRAYIEWLAPRLDEVVAWAESRHAKLREKYSKQTAYAKTATALAHLAIGGELFCVFAEEMGLLTTQETDALVDNLEQHLLQGLEAGTSRQNDTDPVERFLAVLGELVTQKKVRIATPGSPASEQTFGVEVIGEHRDDVVYLLPDATWRAVIHAMRDAGETMPVGRTELWTRLHAANYLTHVERDHYDPKVTILDRRQRALWIRADVLGLQPIKSVPFANLGADNDHARAPGVTTTPDAVPAPEQTVRPTSTPTPATTPAGSQKPNRHPKLRMPPPVVGARGATPTKTSSEKPALHRATSVDLSTPCPNAPTAPRKEIHIEKAADTLQPAPTPVRDPIKVGVLFPPGARGIRGAVGRLREATTPSRPCTTDEQGEPDAEPDAASSISAALAANIAKDGTVAVVVDTSGPNPLKDELRAVTFATATGGAVTLSAKECKGAVTEALKRATVVAHGAQNALLWLKGHLDVEPRGVFCTQVAAVLLDGGRLLAARPDGKTATDYVEKVFDLTSVRAHHLPQGPTSLFDDRSARGQDAADVLALAVVLEAKIEAAGLHHVFFELEMPLLPVVTQMTRVGIHVDVERLAASGDALAKKLEELRSNLDRHLGVPLGNHRAVTGALREFGILASGSGKESLAGFRGNPLVDDLIVYRAINAFMTGQYPQIQRALDGCADHRIHPSCSTIAAVNGRMTVTNPPVQSIPEDVAGVPVRSCFTAPERRALVRADTSQIDLRVVAEYTHEPAMIAAFANGADFHGQTASNMLHRPLDSITREERSISKEVNFGIVYGQTARGLATVARAKFNMEMTEAQAQQFIDAYLEAYPGVRRWQDATRANPPSVVRSLSGRLRYFEDPPRHINQALNFPISATTADGLKRTMILLSGRLKPFDAQIVHSEHDELLVECPAVHAQAVADLVRQSFEEGMGAYVKSVPIRVEVKIGATWAMA